MKYSIGVDIVDVPRFVKSIKRAKNLAKRLFTEHELEYCKKKSIDHLASRFAAKEAFIKACDYSKFNWQYIEVRNMPSGKPYFVIDERLRKKLRVKAVELSISNTKKSAIGMVMVEKE